VGFWWPAPFPSQAEITQALTSVGADKMRFDPLRKTIRFTDAHTRIDLGGIAKGYGVDLVAGGLRRAGTTDALIDLSGNMVALGNAAGKDGWTVGVRDPSGERPYLGTIRLHDEAISTSGNYEQFVDVDGKRYGHIIDPRTGWRPSCDNLTCHGGGIRGTFELSPSGDKDVAFDFAQARLQVNGNDPVSSPLIMKPLAPECGGPGHAGGFVFTELDNPDYLAILAWIEAGEYR
jgi:hypothetical protein